MKAFTAIFVEASRDGYMDVKDFAVFLDRMNGGYVKVTQAAVISKIDQFSDNYDNKLRLPVLFCKTKIHDKTIINVFYS